MKKLRRETTVWHSQYGEKELVMDMPDTHVLNVLHYLKGARWRGSPFGSRSELLDLFRREVALRRLKPVGRQIPHQDPKGRWRIWDFGKHRSILIENSRTP